MEEIKTSVLEQIENLFLQEKSLDIAIPELLSILAHCLDSQWIIYWKVSGGRLKYSYLWKSPALNLIELEKDSKKRKFSLGEGMPGRVWRKSRPEIVCDITADMSIPRSLKASTVGLVSGIWFPIIHNQTTYGVIEMMKIKNNFNINDLKFIEELSPKLITHLMPEIINKTSSKNESSTMDN